MLRLLTDPVLHPSYDFLAVFRGPAGTRCILKSFQPCSTAFSSSAHDRRRILHCQVTSHPTSAWVIQQLHEAFPFDSAPGHLIFDRGPQFNDEVIETVKSFGIQPRRTSFRSPWQNGVAERWVCSCRRDLFDHVMPEPYHTMVISALFTGLRIEEILALDWIKINFPRLCMKVEEAVVHGRLGPVKTEYSDDELPLAPEFATVLLDWKRITGAGESGLVFPSHITGRCYHASPLQQDWIRRAGWCLVECPECGAVPGVAAADFRSGVTGDL
jgi:hypothetical protein